MSKHIYFNCAIECNSAEIISRAIVKSALLNIDKIGLCFTYKCSRNSEAKIIKELNPKKSIYCEESFLDKDDCLEGENIYVLINKAKPYTPYKINHTGRHKAQTFTSKEFTFAKITKRISGNPEPKIPLTLTQK